MYTQPSALQIRWGNILAQVINALSNHLLPVTDGVIALGYLNQMPLPTFMQL